MIMKFQTAAPDWTIVEPVYLYLRPAYDHANERPAAAGPKAGPIRIINNQLQQRR